MTDLLRRFSHLLLAWGLIVLPGLSMASPAVPSFSAQFSPDTMSSGNVTTLSFTISNNSGSPAQDLAFSGTLPTGVTIAAGSQSNSCSNSNLTATAGGTSISFSGGRLGGGSSCLVSLPVTSSTAGTHVFTSGALTSDLGNSGTATDDLTVNAAAANFSKSLSQSTVTRGNTTVLTYDMTVTVAPNPGSPSLDFFYYTTPSFSETLPAGLTFSSPLQATTDCGGTVDLDSEAGTIDFAGPAFEASGTCRVTVGLQAVTSGSYVLSNSVTFLNYIPGTTSETAAVTLTVPAPPTAGLDLLKSFDLSQVAPGGSVTLTFDLTNLDTVDSATDIALSDDLDAMLTGLVASSLPTDPCGSGSSLSGSSTLILSGGTLAARSSCSFDVTLTVPGGATPGSYNNTTSAVTANYGGTPYTGPSASSSLTIADPDLTAPSLTKSYTTDPVAPGDTVTLEYALTNSSTTEAASAIGFSESFDDLSGLTIASGTGSVCGGTMSQTSASPVILTFSGGSLATGASCTIPLVLQIPAATTPGDYAGSTSLLTAVMGGSGVSGPAASDTLQVEGGANLTFTQVFSEDRVGANATATLTFTLTSAAESPNTATGLAFSDDLSSFLSGATLAITSNSCGGSAALSAGDTLLNYTGGTLAPGASCSLVTTVSIPGSVSNGTYSNTTSTLTGTAGGESLVVPASSDSLQVLAAVPLEISKSFAPSAVLPGETVTLTYTLTNPDPSLDYTSTFFLDRYSRVLSGLVADGASLPAGGFCGAGSAASGTTTGNFSGITVSANSSCVFSVDLLVPSGAADGSYVSASENVNTTQGSSLTLGTMNDTLVVESGLLSLVTSYASTPTAPGDTVTTQYTLTNLSSSHAVDSIVFTDDLNAQLSGLTSSSGALADICGAGSAISGTTSLSFSGGTLAAGASCSFDITQVVPAGASANTYAGATGTPSGMSSGIAVSGTVAAANLTVSSTSLPSFSKSFADPALVAGGSTTLTYVITNTDPSASLTALRFSDDLDAVLSGLAVTAGTGSNLCGSGSSVSGSGVITLDAGQLPPNGSCSIPLTVTLPAAAAVGSYSSTSGDLYAGGSFAAAGANAGFSVEPAPGFSLALSPAPIAQGGVTTATFTIDNSASALTASSLDVSNTLPAGLVVAPTPNVSVTCTGGTATAVPGGSVISYTGGSVTAGASCTISLDLRATAVGTLVNTTGDLTSSLGNSGTATQSLTVSAAPLPGFTKSFASSSATLGVSTTLSFAIDNSSALIEATALDFTDTLPAGMVVASPANASVTCSGGSLTALAGSGTISYTGGAVAASSGCGLSVDVIASTSGTLVNTTGDLTSSLGNSGPASASLKLPTLSFDSPLAGDDIVNAVEAPATPISGTTTLIETGRSVSVTVTDSASGTASGSASVNAGVWTLAIDLSGLSDGPLSLTADVSDAAGTPTPQASASLTLDTDKPSVSFDSPLAGDNIVAAAEAGALTISGSASGLEDGRSVSVLVIDSATSSVSGSANVSSNTWSLVVDLSTLSDGALSLTADASDSVGNPVDQASTSLTLDLNAPSGYSASFDQDPVTLSTETALSFTFASAEVGSQYAYSISSDGGGTDVTGSGTIASASDQITGIDVSGLGDGTLTLAVILTDSASQAGIAATDTTSKDTSQASATLSGPTTAQSSAFSVDLVFGKAVTGLVDTAFVIDGGSASALTGSGTTYSFTVTPDHDGTITISLPAGSAQDGIGNGNLDSNSLTVAADLTGTPDPTPPADADGDGVPDYLESSSADRDGDGIVDSADYDPQGYFYCEDDGRILSGGGITVTGPSGSNSTVGISNNINIVRDGSTGEYQWFALVPGSYSVAYSYPSTGVASTTRLSSGTLDVTSLLPANPAVLGSTEVGSTGVLASGSLAANPSFYDTFVIEAGDPDVLANNIPMTNCQVIEVSVSASDNGAEANDAIPDSAGFTISQSLATAQDSVISYSLTGTATSGSDYTAPSGSVTILAGDTSAQVDLPVLEDGLIEGAETITLTVTAVTSASPGVVLSTTTADLSGTATLADDDFAGLQYVLTDLTATEGSSDTASMAFTLTGQPTQDVLLSFAGDAQCSVSPAQMTFTSVTYASAQVLTITAIDDAIAEGAHSCQPTVGMSSADTRFVFATPVALPQITITDDLVDQIRDPLTEILKNDLEDTLGSQQRHFSGIAKGALARLQAGEAGLGCGTLASFDVDGSINTQGGTGGSDGTFGYDVYNCGTGSRDILAGSFSLTRTENIGTQALVQFSRQRERFLSESDLRGKFWGGYLSRTNVTGLADGAIHGFGVNGGLYGARQLGTGLFLDYYAAGGFGHHRFDLSFANAGGAIQADGSYDYAAAYAGIALSGRHQRDKLLIIPRVGLDLAYALAGDADVTATQLGLTSTGSIDIPNYNGGRFFAEVEIAGLGSQQGDDPRSVFAQMSLTPRVICEMSSYDSSLGCGLGLSFSREVFNPMTGLSYSFEIDYENVDETDRVSVDFHRERRFANERGAIVTRLSMPSSDAFKIEHGLRLDF